MEPLEDRRLLAVTILEETFKALPYSVDGTFSGTTEIPSFGYEDAYSGTTSDSGTMVYTSPAQGEGPITITGTGSGSDNAGCPAYDFSFAGSGTLADDNGSLSRFNVEFDQVVYVPPGCNSGGPSQFDRDMAGTFSTSDFLAELSWDVDVSPDGTSSGSWSGTIAFEGTQFDIEPVSASFDADDVLEFEFVVTGKPVNSPAHDTPVADLQLFWATGPDAADVVGGPLATPVPVYWNQAGGRAQVTDLPAAPDEATYLLLIADYAEGVDEADETNNVLVVGGNLKMEDVVWNAERDFDPTQRGFDFVYSVNGGPVIFDPQVRFHWADGPTEADQLGGPIETLSLDSASGDYFVNVPARWGVPPTGTTHILLIAEAQGDTNAADNVLALRLHSPEEILRGALVIDPSLYDGTSEWIAPLFVPGNEQFYTLSEAEVSLGVDHFNWVQRVTDLPDDWSLATRLNRYLTPPVLEPYVDPPTGVSNQNEVLVAAPDLIGTLADLPVDDAVFYWDEPNEITDYSHDVFLEFLDAPRFPDEAAGPSDYWQYETSLVGVSAAGELVALPIVDGVSNSFSWKTDALYDSQPDDPDTQVYLKALDDGTLPPVISGGVFDVVVLDNGTPLARPDAAETSESDNVTIEVLLNDDDVDGTLDPATVAVADPPSNGSVSIDPVTGQMTYTPDGDFVGIDRFTYTVQDDLGGVSNRAQVEVRVRSDLGEARHTFTVRVDTFSDPQQQLGTTGIQVGDVLSGNLDYDTGLPLGEMVPSGAELTLTVGNAVFPAADAVLAEGDLRFEFWQEYSDQVDLVAQFDLGQGQPPVTRLPACLEGAVGDDPQLVFRGTDQQDQVAFELTGTIETITCATAPPWQNPDDRLNVDADEQGRIQPRDALLIINRLARNGVEDLPDPPLPDDQPPPYYDVNGDGKLAPIDALLVINFLASQFGGGGGEGEAAPAELTARDVAGALPGSLFAALPTGVRMPAGADQVDASLSDAEPPPLAWDPGLLPEEEAAVGSTEPADGPAALRRATRTEWLLGDELLDWLAQRRGGAFDISAWQDDDVD